MDGVEGLLSARSGPCSPVVRGGQAHPIILPGGVLRHCDGALTQACVLCHLCLAHPPVQSLTTGLCSTYWSLVRRKNSDLGTQRTERERELDSYVLLLEPSLRIWDEGLKDLNVGSWFRIYRSERACLICACMQGRSLMYTCACQGFWTNRD